MASQSYDLRKEPAESWTVFDVFTGYPRRRVSVWLTIWTRNIPVIFSLLTMST
ncbi:hypothetical protein X753_32290 [Mesorhizobium sp. LNJC399B00]|nr:hypothetical protein X753_32290 [Mesorhizobium sp. LNJC399B00]ESZ45969.1 hypothetical protein X730_22475 [Mesorhizobium sp. L103C565B0]